MFGQRLEWILDYIGAHQQTGKEAGPPGAKPAGTVIGYFAKHTDRLGYCGRSLRSGDRSAAEAWERILNAAGRMGRRLNVPGPRVGAGPSEGMGGWR